MLRKISAPYEENRIYQCRRFVDDASHAAKHLHNPDEDWKALLPELNTEAYVRFSLDCLSHCLQSPRYLVCDELCFYSKELSARSRKALKSPELKNVQFHVRLGTRDVKLRKLYSGHDTGVMVIGLINELRKPDQGLIGLEILSAFRMGRRNHTPARRLGILKAWVLRISLKGHAGNHRLRRVRFFLPTTWSIPTEAANAVRGTRHEKSIEADVEEYAARITAVALTLDHEKVPLCDLV